MEAGTPSPRRIRFRFAPGLSWEDPSQDDFDWTNRVGLALRPFDPSA
jgi:hypothetical protein